MESVKGGGSKWRGEGGVESGSDGKWGGRGKPGGGREGKAWRGRDGGGRHWCGVKEGGEQG